MIDQNTSEDVTRTLNNRFIKCGITTSWNGLVSSTSGLKYMNYHLNFYYFFKFFFVKEDIHSALSKIKVPIDVSEACSVTVDL